jgi:hypothetical protein
MFKTIVSRPGVGVVVGDCVTSQSSNFTRNQSKQIISRTFLSSPILLGKYGSPKKHKGSLSRKHVSIFFFLFDFFCVTSFENQKKLAMYFYF